MKSRKYVLVNVPKVTRSSSHRAHGLSISNTDIIRPLHLPIHMYLQHCKLQCLEISGFKGYNEDHDENVMRL